MSELKTHLQVHARYVVTPCYCCGQDYEQQFVTVYLLDGEKRLGTICPSCLVQGPRRTSARIHEYADQLRAEAEQVYEQYPHQSLPQQGWVMPAEVRAENLVQFADRLAKMGDRWNTSLQEVIEAEKNYFIHHFQTLAEEYVCRLVDLRYQQHIQAAAELEAEG